MKEAPFNTVSKILSLDCPKPSPPVELNKQDYKPMYLLEHPTVSKLQPTNCATGLNKGLEQVIVRARSHSDIDHSDHRGFEHSKGKLSVLMNQTHGSELPFLSVNSKLSSFMTQNDSGNRSSTDFNTKALIEKLPLGVVDRKGQNNMGISLVERVQKLQKRIEENEKALRSEVDLLNSKLTFSRFPKSGLKQSLTIPAVHQFGKACLNQENVIDLNLMENLESSLNVSKISQIDIDKKVRQIQSLKKEVKRMATIESVKQQCLKLETWTKSTMQKFNKHLANKLTQELRKSQGRQQLLAKEIKKVEQKIQQSQRWVKSNPLFESMVSKKSNQKFLGTPLLLKFREQVSLVTEPQISKHRPQQEHASCERKNALSPNEALKGAQDSRDKSSVEEKLEEREITYFVDEEGHLLDHSGFYLLNQNEQKIKLSPTQFEEIKRHQLVQHGI